MHKVVIEYKIYSLRTERGWSLKQLAIKSSVSKAQLQAIETQNIYPRINTLILIANAFEVTVNDLFDYIITPDE